VTESWALKLFNKSVVKQQKYRELACLLGDTTGVSALDIGSDNGVISYLFRQRGGSWASADLSLQTVDAIRALVSDEVYQIDGRSLPFPDNNFDYVVVIDFLEHIPDERPFIEEAARVLKPGGVLILNVPHIKKSLLRNLRHRLGYTDTKHGHLRPGYTIESLNRVIACCFTMEKHHTYSKFFSEFMDTMINWGISVLKGSQAHAEKGIVVTGEDLSNYDIMFRIYSLIYPVVWLVSQIDKLLFFRSGYLLIALARVNKHKPPQA
jgi:ubiquinone/menaquinone biosynthesis C-methylase UbiE